MRVLYVEDNEVNQALVARVMRAQKCQVIFREEGEGALEVLAKDEAIDLVLLDIELAGMMSGLDVVRKLRARGDRRPVVAITAYAMMGDRERILEAGCDQYLPKPLVIPDLLNLLEHYKQAFARSDAAAPEADAVPQADSAKEAANTGKSAGPREARGNDATKSIPATSAPEIIGDTQPETVATVPGNDVSPATAAATEASHTASPSGPTSDSGGAAESTASDRLPSDGAGLDKSPSDKPTLDDADPTPAVVVQKSASAAPAPVISGSEDSAEGGRHE